VWVDGLHVSDAAVVDAVADGVGLDGAAIVDAAAQPAAKARLREQTDAAIARGVFGFPTMTVGDDLFWGLRRLPAARAAARGRDHLDAATVRPWDVPRASATRARRP
jgi:2-hydroxychromene-2-carboxylate isomerase